MIARELARAGKAPLIAVLGLGEMGLIHARALARLGGVRLGLASGRSDALQDASRALYADATWPSYEAALADADVDAVVIATAPPSHPSLIGAAARAGKAIFSEKPLGYASADIRPAIEEVQKAGIARFMTGFMRRWDPGYRRGRELVDSVDIGIPVALKCTSGDQFYPEKYRRPGAGAEHAMLKDLAVHDVDLARWLMRSEVKRAFATTVAMSHPELADFGDSDLAMAVLEMDSGALVTMHLSRVLHYGYNVTSELVCDQGSARLGDLSVTQAVVLQNGGAKAEIPPAFPQRFETAFQLQMEAFAKLVLTPSDDEALALLRSDSSYASAEDGLRATEVAEALIKSSQTGSSVEVVRSIVV